MFPKKAVDAMKKSVRCREVGKICGFIERNDPVPQSFVSHAQACEICLFWLSYSLALAEAFCTTPRILFNQTTCPDKGAFRILIHRMVHDRQFHPLIAEEEMKRNFGENLSGEEGMLAEIWSHLSGCDLCSDYYQTLCYTAGVLRKKYAIEISQGDAVVPRTEHTAREISASTIARIITKCSQTKQ